MLKSLGIVWMRRNKGDKGGVNFYNILNSKCENFIHLHFLFSHHPNNSLVLCINDPNQVASGNKWTMLPTRKLLDNRNKCYELNIIRTSLSNIVLFLLDVFGKYNCNTPSKSGIYPFNVGFMKTVSPYNYNMHKGIKPSWKMHKMNLNISDHNQVYL